MPNTKKILTIIGARPQFIKAAVVSRAFRNYAPDIKEILIHTGQHYDSNMSDVFFQELEIPRPAYHLGVGGGTHGQNTGRMIESIETTLLKEKPDWVLVYGDTDSTLAGAIAASKLHIPIIHIEAGLRSFNRIMPEEINRVLTDHASSLLFAPTESAVKNLSNEGIALGVHRVGDVMYDAALFYGKKGEQGSNILERLNIKSKKYLLATIHRQENTVDYENLSAILNSFSGSPLPVIWPLHPRTRKYIDQHSLTLPKSVRAIEPVGYLDMVMLEKHACTIITDSGGVQKEAFFHRVPCVTLRSETEWVELVEIGANRLIPPSKISGSFIIDVIDKVFDQTPYGEGNSSELIVSILAKQ